VYPFSETVFNSSVHRPKALNDIKEKLITYKNWRHNTCCG
jgi:hypothetical protein